MFSLLVDMARYVNYKMMVKCIFHLYNIAP
jgi:hypothetical protein